MPGLSNAPDVSEAVSLPPALNACSDGKIFPLLNSALVTYSLLSEVRPLDPRPRQSFPPFLATSKTPTFALTVLAF